MIDSHPRDLLGAYADGELSSEETGAVAKHLTACTECARELALIRSMGGAMREMVTNKEPQGLWASVHSRITQPVGWILVTAGIAVWLAMGLMEWFRSRRLSLEWLTLSAVWIGLALIAVGVGHAQYRDWKTTRYKDVHR